MKWLRWWDKRLDIPYTACEDEDDEDDPCPFLWFLPLPLGFVINMPPQHLKSKGHLQHGQWWPKPSSYFCSFYCRRLRLWLWVIRWIITVAVFTVTLYLPQGDVLSFWCFFVVVFVFYFVPQEECCDSTTDPSPQATGYWCPLVPHTPSGEAELSICWEDARR